MWTSLKKPGDDLLARIQEDVARNHGFGYLIGKQKEDNHGKIRNVLAS